MNIRLTIKPIIASMLNQIQGLKERPDLDSEVPVPVSKLEKELDDILVLQKRHQSVGKLYNKLTEFLQERAFRLRELFNSNTLAVGSKYGKYAPELKVVGATPLRGARNRRAPAEAAAPASAPAEADKADAGGKAA